MVRTIFSNLFLAGAVVVLVDEASEVEINLPDISVPVVSINHLHTMGITYCRSVLQQPIARIEYSGIYRY